jgi:hypothetical protein
MLVLASAEGVALITGIATVVGAAILAGVAAVTTNKRLTKQITAERERQERDIVASAERQREELDARTDGQRRQLDHARELADLADLRKLLDEAAIALNDAIDASHRLDVAAAQHGTSLPDDAGDESAALGRLLVTLHARLQVRLGQHDPIAARFDDASKAMWDSWLHARATPEETSSELMERRAHMRDAWRGLNVSNEAFLAAAAERVGTVPAKATV